MVQVYGIKDFKQESEEPQIYVNRLNEHVKEHNFTKLPHKHNFYLFMLVTQGSGKHEIDFTTYTVAPGSVFLMQPGQMHYWSLTKDIDGFVFFHSKEFYEKEYTGAGIHQFKFYRSFQSTPYTRTTKKTISVLRALLQDMYVESRSHLLYKDEKLHSLINLVYITISRVYREKETTRSSKYLNTYNEFEDLIETHFRQNKLPKFYASTLHITEKHLNRICRECVNKTSTQLIADRVLLETKRLLSQHKQNITEIGFELGFNDTSYFVRFFKKQTGETPLNFQRKYFQKA